MAFSKQAALKALSGVKIPDGIDAGEQDIVSAGRVGDLDFKEGHAQLILLIDPSEVNRFEPVRALAEQILLGRPEVKSARAILTAHRSTPQLKPAASTSSRPQKPPQGRPQARPPVRPHAARRQTGYQGDSKIKNIIAVSSAKGGVGKSTVAVNLAAALAKLGKKTGLLDADIHGPSIPSLLGLSGQQAKTKKVKGRALINPLSAHGIKAMSIGFLTDNEAPIVWRGPMVQGAISKMLWDVHWGKLDVLIIDMPPGTGDAQLGLAQDIKPKGALIVSTAQDLALLDTRKGISMYGKVDIPVLGIAENMSTFVCPDCGSSHALFGDDGVQAEAAKLGVPLLAQLPLHMDIRKSADEGVPIAVSGGDNGDQFIKLAEKLWNRFEG